MTQARLTSDEIQDIQDKQRKAQPTLQYAGMKLQFDFSTEVTADAQWVINNSRENGLKAAAVHSQFKDMQIHHVYVENQS